MRLLHWRWGRGVGRGIVQFGLKVVSGKSSSVVLSILSISFILHFEVVMSASLVLLCPKQFPFPRKQLVKKHLFALLNSIQDGYSAAKKNKAASTQVERDAGPSPNPVLPPFCTSSSFKRFQDLSTRLFGSFPYSK